MVSKNKSHKRRTQRRSRRQNGGDYAFTNAVYGNPQQAMDGRGNEIAVMNKSPSLSVGGRRKRNGGGILTDVAVPAILLYANNSLGSRSKYGHGKSVSFNKSRRFRR